MIKIYSFCRCLFSGYCVRSTSVPSFSLGRNLHHSLWIVDFFHSFCPAFLFFVFLFFSSFSGFAREAGAWARETVSQSPFISFHTSSPGMHWLFRTTGGEIWRGKIWGSARKNVPRALWHLAFSLCFHQTGPVQEEREPIFELSDTSQINSQRPWVEPIAHTHSLSHFLPNGKDAKCRNYMLQKRKKSPSGLILQ